MEDDAPVIYGLEFQARSLTAQVAETDAVRFFVGTQSLRFENQIHHIDFDDENNIINKVVYLHKEGEIWQISSAPFQKDILATVYNKSPTLLNGASDSKAEMVAAIWRVPGELDTLMNDDNMANAPLLDLVTRLEAPDYGDMKSILWHPSGDDTDVISLADNHIMLWDLNVSDSQAKMTASTALDGKTQPKFTSGRWNPHHNCTQIATVNDTCIRGWDIRTMKQMFIIENAHGQLVRDVDFNPNKQYYLASCGDDCKAKFWDIRNPTKPLKVLSEHSHWAWSVRYNHFHDQLVLTSSSDSRVILNNLVSISSEPFGHMVDEDEEGDQEEDDLKESGEERLEDGVISVYEEHEDSVYAAEWSTADPWTFASLSCDGRLVINRVPRATKYKILL